MKRIQCLIIILAIFCCVVNTDIVLANNSADRVSEYFLFVPLVTKTKTVKSEVGSIGNIIGVNNKI